MYLLKDRAHVPSVIKKYFNKIKFQFSTSPNLFCTNNALEFVQNEIAEFCASLGVLHQAACPHTSHQNDVTKKKYSHILDVTRTLMIHMNVPKYLSFNAILTTFILLIDTFIGSC